jgi:hypothetical protein
MLAALPLDILEHIAQYVASRDSLGPPVDLVNLGSVCRDLYYTLSFQHNPTVFANLFRQTFDTAAPNRRFYSEILSDGVRRTGSAGLASELKARFTALRYMRAVVDMQNVLSFHCEETNQHLWTAYFMCIESDGKNRLWMTEYGKLPEFARLCVDQYLFQSFEDGDLFDESIDRTLMMWVAWFSTSWGEPHNAICGRLSSLTTFARNALQ